MKKMYIIDFQDSFTYNIVAEVKKLNFYKIEVHDHLELDQLVRRVLLNKEEVIFLLGPGPGHPRDYQLAIDIIKNLINQPFVFLFGICLGHQLIWSSLGQSIVRSKKPLHGQSVPLLLDKYWSELLQLKNNCLVQRYNSLIVKIKDLEYWKSRGYLFCFVGDELMMSRGGNFLTYQFHPESVGTSYPGRFFCVLRRLSL